MKASVESYIKCCDRLKKCSGKAFAREDYASTLRYISVASNIAYNINTFFADRDMESLISSVSNNILPKNNFIPISKRVVFYDFFGIDNRGLTQQYIRALMSLDVEFLYILEGDTSRSEHILAELDAYEKATVFIVDKTQSQIDKIRTIYNRICEYRPQKAFLHLSPNDATAIAVFYALPQVTRYQVNLTDHAFWLGVGCIDYSLDFRSYGCTISRDKRGLRPNQLILNPYYPITDCKDFQGFPSEVEGKTVIFTGGSYYKMYGEDFIFFDLLKSIVEQNNNTVIIIAGSGDDTPLRNFIAANKLESSLLMLGNRTDITHVFEHCDIYLGSYPSCGGLMTQYAAMCGKPIVQYNGNKLDGNFIETLLSEAKADLKLTFCDKTDFFAQIKRLVEDKEYRKTCGDINKSSVVTAELFTQRLDMIINNNLSLLSPKYTTINYDKVVNWYADIENKTMSVALSLLIELGCRSIFLCPRLILRLPFTSIFWRKVFKRLIK